MQKKKSFKNFRKFTEKHLCWGTFFLQNTFGWLILKMWCIVIRNIYIRKKIMEWLLLLLLLLMNLYTGYKTSVFIQIFIICTLVSMSVLFWFEMKMIYRSVQNERSKKQSRKLWYNKNWICEESKNCLNQAYTYCHGGQY